ncbi:hypothetical protein SARC_01703 [Sphaeroforma arctica JP610]|uniref:Uncharacterized protein n=1 Tax=Sphaeroforma arctica JP610 TaxID=667725 RepID=A0A0L0GB62_9EUKA|nr:hypothetical protein SARC_01703 [Sphaeroforma arctica JP610]KNC86134.1 hypothetical protein SARC_01703 [Sphaeroforma arctica JP610]|eukprot:XP_014160036.1 hypothetical protein SARC_01703 [Sphaeroforma arctica JP610]
MLQRYKNYQQKLMGQGLTNEAMMEPWNVQVNDEDILMKVEAHFETARGVMERKRNEAATRAQYPGLDELSSKLNSNAARTEVSEQ